MIVHLYEASGWGTGALLYVDGALVDHEEPTPNRRSPGPVGEAPGCVALAERLSAYYAGGVDAFADVDLEAAGDWFGLADTDLSLLLAIRLIPRGETASYGEVAALAGRPRAWRAAGAACARGPLSVIVPYHRVIRADGHIGEYGELGSAHKRRLLSLEGARAR